MGALSWRTQLVSHCEPPRVAALHKWWCLHCRFVLLPLPPCVAAVVVFSGAATIRVSLLSGLVLALCTLHGVGMIRRKCYLD
ncbi:hypothetical protein V6N13_073067 [Hibiscus sabdariffa]